MNYLVEKVSEYMQQNHMVEEGQKIVVGVSGGADSMGLLFVLSELAEYFHLSLAVVHVNHGLRGQSRRRGISPMWNRYAGEQKKSRVTAFTWI